MGELSDYINSLGTSSLIDKLYLTTLTLSAEAGFHSGRVQNINKLLQVK
jgi:hypothetical protein